MCGIFGIVTENEQVLGPILIEAARRLTYRGYDSVGAATISGAKIDLRKDTGRVDEVAAKYNLAEMSGTRGITQLRWATFGAPSQANSQPHLDSDGDLVGAHNGNVVNNVELRRMFMEEGLVVRSENDGESCVHAVERYIHRGLDFIEAIRRANDDLQGDYAYVIGQINDDKLYAIKKGSGLVVGIGEGFTCVSSDLPSILPLTRTIIRIQDGEIITLWADQVELRSVVDGSLIERAPEEITETMSSVQKDGYDHFMLKEIHEQPQVAREVLHMLAGSADVQLVLDKMKEARNLYFIGCGTSYHACLAGAVYFARLAGRAVIPVLAPQFIPQYLTTVGPQDVGLFVSQSGETKDVLDALQGARATGMACFGMANVIGSTLTRITQAWLPLTCGYEISVPATKTFTNQLITFLFLAYRLGGRDRAELSALPDRGIFVFAVDSDQMTELSEAGETMTSVTIDSEEFGQYATGWVAGSFGISDGNIRMDFAATVTDEFPRRSADPAIEEAASDLGADTPTVFRTIVLPLIRPAFISSLSYTFVRSMTAVSAVIFLISAKWYHLTVLIYNFSENLRFGLASVLATTLIVIVLLTFGLLRLLVRKNENLAKTMSI